MDGTACFVPANGVVEGAFLGVIPESVAFVWEHNKHLVPRLPDGVYTEVSLAQHLHDHLSGEVVHLVNRDPDAWLHEINATVDRIWYDGSDAWIRVNLQEGHEPALGDIQVLLMKRWVMERPEA